MSSTFTVLKKALRILITSLIHPYFHVHFGVKVSRAESELNLALVSPSYLRKIDREATEPSSLQIRATSWGVELNRTAAQPPNSHDFCSTTHPSIHFLSPPILSLLPAFSITWPKTTVKACPCGCLLWIASKCSRWKNLHRQPQSTCHKRTERQTSWPINHLLECKIQLAFKRPLENFRDKRRKEPSMSVQAHFQKRNVSLNGWITQWKAPFIRCLTQVLMCG